MFRENILILDVLQEARQGVVLIYMLMYLVIYTAFTENTRAVHHVFQTAEYFLFLDIDLFVVTLISFMVTTTKVQMRSLNLGLYWKY